jgi:hypothetical protein
VEIELIGCTPDLSASCTGDRVDEIMLYIAQHNLTGKFVAIDDMNLSYMNSTMLP